MKKLFLVALLLLTSIASATVVPQQANNNTGQTFFRLHNNYNVYVSCYYRDAYNYITFTVPPRTSSMWYPVYGYYEWACR